MLKPPAESWMENDSVRTSGANTLVDMWIDGKLRSISISRDAIDGFLRLPPDRTAAMSDHDRREFVRTHLTLVMTAAAEWLRNTEPGADTIAIDAGQLGGQTAGQAGGRSGDRRQGDRRKGDRRKANFGPPPSGERRR
jgi:hypothetical protein